MRDVSHQELSEVLARTGITDSFDKGLDIVAGGLVFEFRDDRLVAIQFDVKWGRYVAHQPTPATIEDAGRGDVTAGRGGLREATPVRRINRLNGTEVDLGNKPSWHSGGARVRALRKPLDLRKPNSSAYRYSDVGKYMPFIKG